MSKWSKNSESRQRHLEHTAQAFIERYGNRAWQEAMQRVVELETLGQREPAAYWSDVADLILENIT